ncbi:MAG: VCBS repeat-containing protein, partial [Caldilineae bacterium]
MAIGICILLGLVGGMPGFVPLEKAAPVDAQTHTVSFPNADFETFPAGGVNDWDWPSDDWVWDGNVAYSGLHAARVSRNGGGGTQSLWSPYLFVRPSTVYTLTYWLRTENATLYPSFKVYQYTVSGTATGLPISSYPNVQTANLSWRRVALRFQTTPDADYIRLRIFLSANTKGVFWFDAFHLEEGTGAAYPLQAGFPVAVPARILLSSPVVADIDHNGSQELLVGTAAGKVEGWDASGNPLSGFPFNTGDERIYSSLAVADLDGDGDMEIVAGTKTPTTGGHGRLFVWHHTGALVNGWPKSVAWSSYASDPSEVRSVALADIDGDGALEILAGTVNNTVKYHGSNPPPSPNAYAWHADGTPVSGTWPTEGPAIYGAIAAGDVNGDSRANFVTGRDHHYLYAYTTTGDALAGWPVATFLDKNGGDTRTDIRIVHGSSAPALADLDGDGTAEYIVAGAVKNPGGQAIQNSGLLVLAADGSRYPGWETAI